MDKIQERLTQIKTDLEFYRKSGEALPSTDPERKRYSRLAKKANEAIKFLEKAPSEDSIKSDIIMCFNKIDVRKKELEKYEEQFEIGAITKDDFLEKKASLSYSIFSSQMNFLRYCLPR